MPPAERGGARFAVELSPAGMRIVGGATPEKIQPANVVSAQFSVFFQVAAAWQEGQVEWAVYDRVHAPELQAAAQRVTATVNAGLPNNAASVAVTAGGKTLRETVLVSLGEPGNWIGDAELRHKFMLLAVPVYGESHAVRLADAVLGLSPEQPMRGIAKMLRLQIEPSSSFLGGIRVSPKRCGHLAGKEVIAREDFLSKIRAAVAARRDPDLVLIARTDARAVVGMDEAVIVADVPVQNGKVKVTGDYSVPGVPGTGAEIAMNWVGTVGARTGRPLPTGHPADEITLEDGRTIKATICDAANPCAWVLASDFGLDGSELVEAVPVDGGMYHLAF